jgi:lipoprotein-anchoring transpeptidase ErfK/SrfK
MADTECAPGRAVKGLASMFELRASRESIGRVLGAVPDRYLAVATEHQRLYVVDKGKIDRSYAVSTSSRGTGNREGSLQTPRGVHRVCEKYGAGAPIGRVFRDRIDTGEDWPIGKRGENLILTRILRLEGLEEGVNKGPGIDSYERYIYIHGTNNEHRIGQPFSQGCVCMMNADVVELYDLIAEGTIVHID